MSQTAPFALPPNTSVLGHVGMIVCWWWDDDDESPGLAARGVALAPQFVAGDTEDFQGGDWFIFYDALGSYPERTPELQRLYESAAAGFGNC